MFTHDQWAVKVLLIAAAWAYATLPHFFNEKRRIEKSSVGRNPENSSQNENLPKAIVSGRPRDRLNSE